MRARAALLWLIGLLAAVLAWSSAAPVRAGDRQLVRGLRNLAETEQVPLALRPPFAFPDDEGPSPVIYPEQAMPLRFNHKKHVKELGMSCTACHEAAKTSGDAGDSLLPSGARCDSCHGTNHTNLFVVSTAEARPLGQCGYCHQGYDAARPNVVARVLLPKPNLRFSHRKHVTGERLGCAHCHGKVEELELATRDQLPRMKLCVSCHVLGQSEPGAATGNPKAPARASGRCATCHLSEPSGALKTQFASGKLLPPPWLNNAGHGPDFIERHKRVAGDDSKFCSTCHQERFCVGCHDGSVRPRKVHPSDFISQHPVAARQNTPRCTSCHQQQSFCLSCHQRAGVAMSGPIANFASRGRFHPPKSTWTDGARSRAHHAWEAERNLNACVSCHQERDCLACHATRAVGGRGAALPAGRGQGVNPHPRGFRSRCAQALRQNPRPCLTCHGPSDEELRNCR
jgi:Cytochrome c7 and related cytochrome c